MNSVLIFFIFNGEYGPSGIFPRSEYASRDTSSGNSNVNNYASGVLRTRGIRFSIRVRTPSLPPPSKKKKQTKTTTKPFTLVITCTNYMHSIVRIGVTSYLRRSYDKSSFTWHYNCGKRESNPRKATRNVRVNPMTRATQRASVRQVFAFKALQLNRYFVRMAKRDRIKNIRAIHGPFKHADF